MATKKTSTKVENKKETSVADLEKNARKAVNALAKGVNNANPNTNTEELERIKKENSTLKGQATRSERARAAAEEALGLKQAELDKLGKETRSLKGKNTKLSKALSAAEETIGLTRAEADAYKAALSKEQRLHSFATRKAWEQRSMLKKCGDTLERLTDEFNKTKASLKKHKLVTKIGAGVLVGSLALSAYLGVANSQKDAELKGYEAKFNEIEQNLILKDQELAQLNGEIYEVVKDAIDTYNLTDNVVFADQREAIANGQKITNVTVFGDEYNINVSQSQDVQNKINNNKADKFSVDFLTNPVKDGLEFVRGYAKVLVKTIDNLEIKLENLEDALLDAELGNNSGIVAELQGKVKELQAELDTTKAEYAAYLETTEAEIEKLLTEKAELEEVIAQTTAELETITAERDELITERDELTAELETVTAERDELQTSFNTLKTEYDELYAEYQEIKQYQTVTPEQVKALEAELKQVKAELDEVEADLSEANAIIEEKDAELEEKDAELEAKDATISEMNNEIGVYETTIVTLNNTIKDRDQTILDMSTRLENTEESLKIANETIKELQDQLNNVDVREETPNNSNTNQNNSNTPVADENEEDSLHPEESNDEYNANNQLMNGR